MSHYSLFIIKLKQRKKKNYRSLISEAEAAGLTSTPDSQNDQSYNLSQTGSLQSYESSEGEEETNIESRSKK